MKKPKLGKDEYIDEKGYIRKKGFLAWIRNFGYYYKSYMIVGFVALGFFLALYFSMRAVSPDLKLYYCVAEPLGDEQFQTLNDNIYPYLIDVDSDDVVYMQPLTLVLTEDPSTTSERTAYRTLEKALEDADVACFITDDFGYRVLEDRGVLRDMEFFGIRSEDPYRLRLNDTALWNGVDESRDFYLVMKYIEDERYTDFYISTIATMIVDMCYDLVGAPEAPAE